MVCILSCGYYINSPDFWWLASPWKAWDFSGFLGVYSIHLNDEIAENIGQLRKTLGNIRRAKTYRAI